MVAHHKSMKLWARYEVRIQKIIGIEVTAIGERHHSQVFEGRVFHFVNGEGFSLPSLAKKIALSSSVSYTEESHNAYLLNFNPDIDEGRTLVIDLHGEGNQTKLASVSVPLREISQRLALEQQVLLEKEFGHGAFFKEGMRICLQAKKVPLQDGFLGEWACMSSGLSMSSKQLILYFCAASKRERACRSLWNVIEWIDRFNDENKGLSSQLSAHICGPHNFSLLHAAVVFEEPKLVRRLMSLGANPQAKSELGSAVAYAMNMAHFAKERLLRDRTALEEKGISLEYARQREKQVKVLEEIVHELQSHMRRPDTTSDSLRMGGIEPMPSTLRHPQADEINNTLSPAADVGQHSGSSRTDSDGSVVLKDRPQDEQEAFELDIKQFLRSVWSKSGREGWARLGNVVTAFQGSTKRDGDGLLCKVLAAITADDLIEWGDEERRNMIVREPKRYLTLPEGSCVRLTRAGTARYQQSGTK